MLRSGRGDAALAIVVALAVALAANTIAVDAVTRAATARSGGSVMETGVVPANVKVEGEGPPIVLIHGFGAALDWWDEIAARLASGHRVIRLDLIGHGGTEAPASGYTIERQAKLVTAVLDKLGIGSVIAIGHSMGGEVATALAEADPSRIERLVLINSPPKPETTFKLGTRLALMPSRRVALALHVRGDDPEDAGARLRAGFPVPEKFVADVKQLTYTAFRTAHNDSMAYETEKPVVERLAALNPVPPLLVIFGSQDALVAPESAKLYERVPGAKVVVLDGPGHSPMVEAPEKTLALIEDFLARPE